MLTYQVRPRVFRLEPGKPLAFPAACEIRLHFQPGQPFGVEAGGGRTAVRGVPATVHFNANNGDSTVESKQPLSPLVVTMQAPNLSARLCGKTFSLSGMFESLRDVQETTESVFFGLPPLLNVAFADPPYVERVDGRIGSVGFRWELSEWRGVFRTTTQEGQEQGFATAWDRMSVLAKPGRRRLLAALHYFHVACRLARGGRTAGEFLAEVVLNLAKTLEVLFPSEKDLGTRDAARRGLLALGLAVDRIEADFIPAMALRNEIDVGHVELGLFKSEHVKAIHSYLERAESVFRDMLDVLLAKVTSGEFEITQHELGPPSDGALKVVQRLEESMPDSPG